MFESVLGKIGADTGDQATPPWMIFGTQKLCFHAASGIDEAVVAKAQTDLRRRILLAFVGRGLIEKADAKEMLTYQHSGFPVNAGVCIEAHDRAALERLLRPLFAMDRLSKADSALVNHCDKPHSEGLGSGGARGTRPRDRPARQLVTGKTCVSDSLGGPASIISWAQEITLQDRAFSW